MDKKQKQTYNLTSWKHKENKTVIDLGDGVKIGDQSLTVIAGPCAVENEEQIFEIAKIVKAAGAEILRGGAFKPRTSPYSFQGLGEKGLKLLAAAREKTGLKIITELMDVEHLELVNHYTDIIQIGSRNMDNYPLLKAVGKLDKPVMLKRGMAATIKEWLLAAEYIMEAGNQKVILCERGIRTFSQETRNTLDLSSVPLVQQLSHLPVIVDPSHGTGRWQLVKPMSKAALAVGADGIMVEVHPQPDDSVSDGFQSLNPNKFWELMQEIKVLQSTLDFFTLAK
ncbi:3-deoxy-7-phosphoheptulonate synthase [Halanaerobium praevalens]|uniref:3-deoxy-D-arabinoheptulosonate-7-phosphate synthase n=1 Tax=Halanaerobium praevalens (strain ATCC 33744 / DSM 2228 / GSL) TaxID=572479 RepID=E3DRQ6_HALPG|nr:3-deoxy-7-phosphoheptulonate synthase [Halanaerobium praevalens]ADO78120.1 3-deoxy-D-arabinoheptulosonate-7-phosphate synthase [Halanaerobium praevalens DSM 2228]